MKTAKLLRLLMIFVGISGAFSVLFGAWLAHGGTSLPEFEQVRLEKALQYQFIHTLALYITAIFSFQYLSKWLMAANVSFVFGILCFSSSLYLKPFFDLAFIGKLAPFGGSLLALGWMFIALSTFSENFAIKIDNKHK